MSVAGYGNGGRRSDRSGIVVLLSAVLAATIRSRRRAQIQLRNGRILTLLLPIPLLLFLLPILLLLLAITTVAMHASLRTALHRPRTSLLPATAIIIPTIPRSRILDASHLVQTTFRTIAQ